MTEAVLATPTNNTWTARFWQEFRLVPRWLIWAIAVLFVLAQINNFLINRWAFQHNGEIFLPALRDTPWLSYLALGGFSALISLIPATFFFMVAYVNRDAKRRGMNAVWWTVLCFLLLPGFFVSGFLLYFLMRKPLPFPCPVCATSVLPEFRFCPNCKFALHTQQAILQT